MIKDKRMQFIKSINGLGFYLFKPSVFRLYYENRKDDAKHCKSFTHKLHMLFYIIRGGYRILYLTKNDKIISYIVFTCAGDRIIKGSTKNDYYTIFLYTFPQYRGQGYATLMANIMLNELNLKYRYFYKTISKENNSSIKVAEKSGFEIVADANKVGLIHKIIPVKNGDQFLYRYRQGE